MHGTLNNSYVLQDFAITGVDGSGDPTGVITQVYDPSVTPGDGTTTIRMPIGGSVINIEVSPKGGTGGTIEAYDITGLLQGGSNNVSTGTSMTAAYVAAQIALGQAKMIWTQAFSGSSANRIARYAIPTIVNKGLAIRVYGDSGTVDVSFTTGTLWRKVADVS